LDLKVSIVTVSFNSAATIRDTIESVLGQDYPSVEYIVIDGGSTDSTMRVVSEYERGISTVVSEPDLGIYDAMNKGISLATGDVVGMLNSDDVYSDSGAVRRMVECMAAAQSDTVFADLVQVTRRDLNRVVRYYDSSRFSLGRLRYGWVPAHPTFMVRKVLYDEWGLFSLDYRIAADYEMMVRLLYRAGASYSYLPSVVVKMRIGGVSTSGLRNIIRMNREIVRACRENGLDTSLARVLLKTPMKLIEYVRRP